MDLHRTQLKEVILPKVKSVYVVDYYEGVRGLLESREEFPYKNIFANPRIRSKTEIIWSTDVFGSEPQKLSSLRGADKDYYAHMLYEQIQAIRNLIETLKTEDGGEPLSELLSRVISNIDDNSVYCADDKIVIVNWGLIPRQPDLQGACIFKSGKFNGNWEQSHKHAPHKSFQDPVPEPVPAPAPEESHDADINDGLPNPWVPGHDGVPVTITPPFDNRPTDTHVDTPKVTPAPADVYVEPAEERKIVIPVEDPKEEKAEMIEEVQKVVEPPHESVPDKESAPAKTDEDKKSEPAVAPKKKGKDDPNQYGWKKFFNEIGKALMFLLKKIWWLLLLILLIILVLFLLRDYQGPLHKVNPFYDPLPKTPIIMPIEDGQVSMSEDGLYEVANNRLNILLEKEGDDTMLEWAKAFKNHYSSSDFRVMYYNTDLYTLQIKVPADQRLQVKHELKQVLDGFSFDVFEESVFTGDFSSNDPALQNQNAAWYLEAIGAYTAWDMTMGSENVKVAVVDNGFDLTHPELAGKYIKPYNVLTRSARLYPIRTSEGVNPHGTHVAATAVGNSNNGSGLLGIAPNCKLIPVQVGNDNPKGSLSSTAILEGVVYAINNGADVVNVSLGMYAPKEVKGMSDTQQLNYISNSFREDEEMWNRVFEMARKRNCIIVFAAGNDNIISGIDPKKRNPSTIRVSAVTPNRTKADFSNYGRFPNLNRDYSTVSAPGVEIFSAKPGNQYAYLQGTSMAAPIVSGSVALLRSVNKSITAEEAIRILQQTGTNIGPQLGPEINLGKAVAMVMGKDVDKDKAPAVDCDKIKLEIDWHKAQIDSLTRLCPGATEPADTLKYEDAVRDPHGLDGTWKTTTNLYNSDDDSPVDLYMTFNNLVGQLIIVNKGNKFTAPLKASIKDNKIYITQSAPATSPQTDTSFVPYTYDCAPDRKGNLFCKAQSATNYVEFNLIRIK